MSLRHAQIDSTGTVVAIILWDGVTAIEPPLDPTTTLVSSDTANVGDTYTTGKPKPFTATAQSVVGLLPGTQLIAGGSATVSSILQAASAQILGGQ